MKKYTFFYNTKIELILFCLVSVLIVLGYIFKKREKECITESINMNIKAITNNKYNRLVPKKGKKNHFDKFGYLKH